MEGKMERKQVIKWLKDKLAITKEGTETAKVYEFVIRDMEKLEEEDEKKNR